MSIEAFVTMRNGLILFGVLLLCPASLWAKSPHAQRPVSTVTLGDLRTEYRENPLGIDAVKPRLSWRIKSGTRGTMQTAYQVRVATSLEKLHLGSDLVWNSGKVTSSQSILLDYAGQPLQSRQRYYWQVRVWNEKGAASAWSEPASWEMGLLSAGEWHAQWIAPTIGYSETESAPAPFLRSTFGLTGKIARARAYVTSLGLYELHLNGERVGDALFTPGWTSFDKRLQYQVYDITPQLKEGTNAVGVVLGDGWYRWVPLNGQRNNGKPFALLLQIEVTYEDGRTQRIVSNSDWKSATGPILRSGIYNGEFYDARLERLGWSLASYDDQDWSSVKLAGSSSASLIATVGPPVKRVGELKPARIFKTPAGLTVVDMGQNMAGWVRLRVQGVAGTTVTLRHAEVLDREGQWYAANLRSAEQKVQYVLNGKGKEVFEPHFSSQGFRYVAVEGYPGLLRPEDVTGIVIHSDLEQTGRLETSNALVNQLQHNIVWTLKGNFLDVPTDCPQRDERLGYGLDAAQFLPTAALNSNVSGFFTKWLGDLAADQTSEGAVPMEVPRTLFLTMPADEFYRTSGPYQVVGRQRDEAQLVEAAGVPGYGDAATTVPWNLYLAYGDVRILDAQYESMKRWVTYVRTQAGDDYIWEPPLNLSDWLDFSTTVLPTRVGQTSLDLMATAFYGHSVDILHRTAVILGKTEDAARYAELLSSIREAFRRRFVTDDGRVGEGTQTAYVLALDFELLPQALRARAAHWLAHDVRSRGHLTTGIAGTQHVLDVLSRFGYDEEAYRLLTRQEMPSWLYPITKGATTIWERWDGIRPDGSFQDPAMNSFNQYALGAIGEWLYGVMAGIAIDPAAPGYKHILIRPRPGGGLAYVKAAHVTPHGEASTFWQIDQDQFDLRVTIPPNTTATVTLPGARLGDVFEGGRQIARANGIQAMRQVGSDAAIEIGSGSYEFKYRIKNAPIEAVGRNWRPAGQHVIEGRPPR